MFNSQHPFSSMVTDYKKFDLFGKTVIQKVDLKAPFEFSFPVAEQACFVYMMKGESVFETNGEHSTIPAQHAVLLNCSQPGKKIGDSGDSDGEIVIVTFHPDLLHKIYEREPPLIFRPHDTISNQSSGTISNDFLIRKYIEGLVFYFENPSLVNEELLVLKLKEIIILLAQTHDAGTIQVILSQLYAPASYSFRQIVEANLFSDINVDELARKTNLSISSFKREFAKLYNDSPASYIKTKRLEKGAELLQISDKRITEIAFECGFNDLANFTKSFSEKYKLSPTSYRNTHSPR